MLFLWQEIVFEHVVQILAERSLRIEGQQKAGPHETVNRVLQQGRVVIDVPITLFDRQPRITAFKPVCLGFGKRNVLAGTFTTVVVVRCGTERPTSVSGERYLDLRQTNTGDIIPIGISLGDKAWVDRTV